MLGGVCSCTMEDKKSFLGEFLYCRRMCFLHCQHVNIFFPHERKNLVILCHLSQPFHIPGRYFKRMSIQFAWRYCCRQNCSVNRCIVTQILLASQRLPRTFKNCLCRLQQGVVLKGNGQPSHPRNPFHMHGKSVWLPHGCFESFGVCALWLPHFGSLCDIPRKYCGFRCRAI